jgi:peptidoglycan/xylan/chitin deacetylase (PgdA/CDA1 family)
MPWRSSAGHATGQNPPTAGARGTSEIAAAPVHPPGVMFEATAPFALFDYFRVPYLQTTSRAADLPAGVASLSLHDGPTLLMWPTSAALAAGRRQPASYELGSIPIFGRLASATEMRAWLARCGDGWRTTDELRAADGTVAGATWRREDGRAFLPFDPNELIAGFWSERYLDYVRPAAVSGLATLMRRSYYRARPLLPRTLQMSMRRRFSRLQSRARFPRWPIETALHDLYAYLFELLTAAAAEPIPYIAPWPRDWSWALVLTHDVETQVGYDHIGDLLDVELEAGYRSSWNFVPRNRYAVQDELLRSLRDRGFEIGVHGLYHDGRDVSSSTLQRRLPAIRAYAEHWQARGFRSPATLRSAQLMPLLGFEYDSSFSDTAPFEPQAGGCCTWLPYMLGDLVELPITLAQDHTLFDLLAHRDERVWLDKARFLRGHGGMALFLTHPDYVSGGHLVEAYRRVLDEFAGDASAWKALPAQVSDWWRRRSRSALQRSDGGWCVVGPAEGEARIDFVTAQASAG